MNYATAKGQYVDRQIKEGKTKQEARRSWSHGYNNPRSQWVRENKEQTHGVDDGFQALRSLNGMGGSEWDDYAHTADDL